MDLQKHKITALVAASVTVPRATIEALITDSSTGAVLFDFTGANAVNFPLDIAGYTAVRRLVLAQLIAQWMLFEKAGLNS